MSIIDLDQDGLRKLVDQVDVDILNILKSYTIDPLEMVGIILARLSSLMKEVNREADLLVLLEHAKLSLLNDTKRNTVLH